MNINGWIVYNGHLPGTKFADFAEWLQCAAFKQNIDIKLYKNNELLAYLGNDNHALLGDQLSLPDFVIFTDKDIYLARQLESLGIRVFNSSKAIEVSDDKIATYQALAEQHLPIPKTIIAPKIFPSTTVIDHTFTQHAIKKLGFPMVLKEAFGSFGEQVYLVHNQEQMLNKIKEIIGKPFLFQEFISSSYGRDIRIHVVGDTVVASMIRNASNDFRANVTAGGTMEPYEPSEAEKELAIAATKVIGADFTGVDLLFGPNNNSLICEINSNAHIRNIYECTKVNVADYIINYIINTFRKDQRHLL
ncbi:ATP-grasp domain-containing protein [Virgibacillus oceani]|uniref:Alpha-L-glutamate ligase n=1 Tax=Virgibacillus oceani TaxID=1479511 RepID=A0A917LXK9_9BACI|nr:RimK family alpha-L-glutamate ligase [Virgibacillus oceani]GGG62419.1 alpha-L-glutamate ligase [Virgibacillus oceani]